MTQHTAVEWFLEAIGYKQESDRITIINIHPDCDITDLIEQAKQMEKEQIISAYHQGVFGNIIINNGSALAEHYFNKTYGSNNQI